MLSTNWKWQFLYNVEILRAHTMDLNVHMRFWMMAALILGSKYHLSSTQCIVQPQSWQRCGSWCTHKIQCPTKMACLASVDPKPGLSWWRHRMETFSASLALCEVNSPVTGEFPSQRPVTHSFDVFVDLRLNNRWAHSRDAGDLRRHSAHCDVTEMCTPVETKRGCCDIGYPSKTYLYSNLAESLSPTTSFSVT